MKNSKIHVIIADLYKLLLTVSFWIVSWCCADIFLHMFIMHNNLLAHKTFSIHISGYKIMIICLLWSYHTTSTGKSCKVCQFYCHSVSRISICCVMADDFCYSMMTITFLFGRWRQHCEMLLQETNPPKGKAKNSKTS